MKKNRIVALSMLTLLTFSSIETIFLNHSIASGEIMSETADEEGTVLDIPDINFRKFLVQSIKSKREPLPSDLEGTNPDETLYITDKNRLSEIKKISLYKRNNVTNLKGIEYLRNLTDLICNYSDLSSQTLDLSSNINLIKVTVIGSEVNSINVNGLQNLEQLRLGENKLSKIDLSTNIGLKELALDHNNFSEIDISKNLSLEKIFFGNEEEESGGNTIKSLDLSKHISLKEVDVQNLGIESITGIPPSIRAIYANNNNLKAIDVSNCPLLKNAVLNDNKLEQLDVKKNKNLEWLYCSNNSLKSLNLSENTKLVYAENINYISNQESKAQVVKENDKWILDMASLIGKENIKNIKELSSGNIDEHTGKIVFDRKPDELTYQYNTGLLFEGESHIALGTMKDVKLILEEKEEEPVPQEKVTVWVQYVDPNKVPANVKLEKVTAEMGSEVKLNIPEGYELVDDQEIPKVTKSNQVIKIKVKSNKKVNRDELKAQIEKAEKLISSTDFNKYTEASKHEVIQQLKYAKIVYEDMSKSQQSVDDQTNALIHFMEQLKEKPVKKERVLKIPDENLRSEIYFAIQRAVDPKPQLEDGEQPYESFNLYTSDLELLRDAEYIQIDNSSIADLTGLEYLSNIHSLEITNAPNLKKVDLSKNEKLRSVDLSNTGVEELRTGAAKIKVLKAENNKIKKLDLSKNSDLEKIYLNSGSIEELTTGSIGIKEIQVVANKIKELNLSKNKSLEELFVGSNGLKEIILPEKSSLININALDNNLSDIDLSNQLNLSNLVVSQNKIKSLDISENTKLNGLACYENDMENITFGDNSELSTLLCDRNMIKSIDLSNLTKLESLDIKNNKLSALNLSANKMIRDLYGKELLSPQKIEVDVIKSSENEDIELKAEDIVGKLNVENILSTEGAEFNSKGKVFKLKSDTDSFTYAYKTESDKLPEMVVHVELNITVKETPEEDSDDTPTVVPKDTSDDEVNKNPGNSSVENPIEESIDKIKFVDISNHWAKGYIQKVAIKGLFKGTSETEFSPELNMTRGMFVTVLGRLADEKSLNGNQFEDVSSEAYYFEYVAWAEENGIVKGYGDGTFRPDNNVTREEMATIIMRFMEYKGIELEIKTVDDFSDKDKVSEWAKESVDAIHKSGIIEGKGRGIFDPKANSTRAEVATLMIRMIEKYMEK